MLGAREDLGSRLCTHWIPGDPTSFSVPHRHCVYIVHRCVYMVHRCADKTPIHIKNLNLKCLLKRTIEKQAVYLPTSKVPPVKRRACSTKPYSKVKETWAALLRQHADGGSWLEGISVRMCGASAKNTHVHMFMVCSIEGHRDPVSLAYTGLPG